MTEGKPVVLNQWHLGEQHERYFNFLIKYHFHYYAPTVPPALQYDIAIPEIKMPPAVFYVELGFAEKNFVVELYDSTTRKRLPLTQEEALLATERLLQTIVVEVRTPFLTTN
jgi:hypothetical protein